jgi:hypothetical protein
MAPQIIHVLNLTLSAGHNYSGKDRAGMQNRLKGYPLLITQPQILWHAQ